MAFSVRQTSPSLSFHSEERMETEHLLELCNTREDYELRPDGNAEELSYNSDVLSTSAHSNPVPPATSVFLQQGLRPRRQTVVSPISDPHRASASLGSTVFPFVPSVYSDDEDEDDLKLELEIVTPQDPEHIDFPVSQPEPSHLIVPPTRQRLRMPSTPESSAASLSAPLFATDITDFEERRTVPNSHRHFHDIGRTTDELPEPDTTSHISARLPNEARISIPFCTPMNEDATFNAFDASIPEHRVPDFLRNWLDENRDAFHKHVVERFSDFPACFRSLAYIVYASMNTKRFSGRVANHPHEDFQYIVAPNFREIKVWKRWYVLNPDAPLELTQWEYDGYRVRFSDFFGPASRWVLERTFGNVGIYRRRTRETWSITVGSMHYMLAHDIEVALATRQSASAWGVRVYNITEAKMKSYGCDKQDFAFHIKHTIHLLDRKIVDTAHSMPDQLRLDRAVDALNLKPVWYRYWWCYALFFSLFLLITLCYVYEWTDHHKKLMHTVLPWFFFSFFMLLLLIISYWWITDDTPKPCRPFTEGVRKRSAPRIDVPMRRGCFVESIDWPTGTVKPPSAVTRLGPRIPTVFSIHGNTLHNITGGVSNRQFRDNLLTVEDADFEDFADVVGNANPFATLPAMTSVQTRQHYESTRKHWPPYKRAKYLALVAKHPRLDPDIMAGAHKTFIKTEIVTTGVNKAPRVISAASDEVMVNTAHIYGSMSKHLKTVFDGTGTFYWASGRSLKELGEWFTTSAALYGNDVGFFENDYAKFDSSQGPWVWATLRAVYDKLLANCSPEEKAVITKHMELLSQHWHADFHSHKDDAHARFMVTPSRASGDPDTTVGNGIVNMMLLTYAIVKSGLDLARFRTAIAGDDSLMLGRIADLRLINLEHISRMGIACTPTVSTNYAKVEFCSKVFIRMNVPTGRRNAHGEHILRAAYVPVVKLGRTLARAPLTHKYFVDHSPSSMAYAAIKMRSLGEQLFYIPGISQFYLRLADHYARQTTRAHIKKVARQARYEYTTPLGYSIRDIQITAETFVDLASRYDTDPDHIRNFEALFDQWRRDNFFGTQDIDTPLGHSIALIDNHSEIFDCDEEYLMDPGDENDSLIQELVALAPIMADGWDVPIEKIKHNHYFGLMTHVLNHKGPRDDFLYS